MIKIGNEQIKLQKNFWNNCIFHPTDAVEDPWGRRILDRMAKDKAIQTVRIYTMMEDILYDDGTGKLAYDFRLNDLRLDYLVEKGYDILLAYGMIPECIASDKNATSCVSKNKTRYKGKLINTSVPTDYDLWEELCYEYTKHIVERYGIERVSGWHLHCYNEPDIAAFFLSSLPDDEVDMRIKEYCRLYHSFEKGLRRVSDSLCIGGPALASGHKFLEEFLIYVKENNLKLDYIALHNYAGTGPNTLNKEGGALSVGNWLEIQQGYTDVIEKCGFGGTEIVVDEWGMASHGFFNIEECPAFIARETEVFSAYYVKLIYEIIKKNLNISKLMICLSGQHEMVTDFSGFRNFFTLNFFAKPIYNAYVLAARLFDGLLHCESENENVYTIPTRSKNGEYSMLVTYSGKTFEENLPVIKETLCFDDDITGKKVTLYCIDKNHTNPYRLCQKNGIDEISEEHFELLRNEGNIKPCAEFAAESKITLDLTPNCVYLVEIR